MSGELQQPTDAEECYAGRQVGYGAGHRENICQDVGQCDSEEEQPVLQAWLGECIFGDEGCHRECGSQVKDEG